MMTVSAGLYEFGAADSSTTDTTLKLHEEFLVKCEAEILDGVKFDQGRKLTGELVHVAFGQTHPCTKPYELCLPCIE